MDALVDGKNFYVSERVLCPSLVGCPVVVSSSNDGCAIVCSSEAKASGIRGRASHRVMSRHFEVSKNLLGCFSGHHVYPIRFVA